MGQVNSAISERLGAMRFAVWCLVILCRGRVSNAVPWVQVVCVLAVITIYRTRALVPVRDFKGSGSLVKLVICVTVPVSCPVRIPLVIIVCRPEASVLVRGFKRRARVVSGGGVAVCVP